jgi:hypothetical protein
MNNKDIKSITGDITPLPWKFEENEFNWKHDFNGIGSIISSRESNDKWFVAEIEQGCKHHIEKFSSEQLESKANAAYIVKAANEYPSLKLLNNELVEALENLVGDCQNINGKIIEPSEHFLSKAKELIQKAKQ